MSVAASSPLTTKKSKNAFRTIGEVSAELGLPQHVLRFWESKFPQIKPHKRRGGHRYYRPADVETLQHIKSLLHDKGYTIKGAQKHLQHKKDKPAVINQPELFTPQEVKQQPTLDRFDIKKMQSILEELKAIQSLLSSS